MQSKDKRNLLILGAALLFISANGNILPRLFPSGDRGYRNNNPGNIRKSTDVFDGEVIPSTDPSFKQFIDMAHGYRAIFKIIQTKIGRGVNTIQRIITEWAPPNENDTQGYIDFVANTTGVPYNKYLSYFDNPTDIVKVVKAISQKENGIAANTNQVSDGYQLWLNTYSS